jgi:hypothetical protein
MQHECASRLRRQTSSGKRGYRVSIQMPGRCLHCGSAWCGLSQQRIDLLVEIKFHQISS